VWKLGLDIEKKGLVFVNHYPTALEQVYKKKKLMKYKKKVTYDIVIDQYHQPQYHSSATLFT